MFAGFPTHQNALILPHRWARNARNCWSKTITPVAWVVFGLASSNGPVLEVEQWGRFFLESMPMRVLFFVVIHSDSWNKIAGNHVCSILQLIREVHCVYIWDRFEHTNPARTLDMLSWSKTHIDLIAKGTPMYYPLYIILYPYPSWHLMLWLVEEEESDTLSFQKHWSKAPHRGHVICLSPSETNGTTKKQPHLLSNISVVK